MFDRQKLRKMEMGRYRGGDFSRDYMYGNIHIVYGEENGSMELVGEQGKLDDALLGEMVMYFAFLPITAG